MQKIKVKLITALVSTLTLSTTFAAIPNTSSNPTTFLGPTAHLGVVKAINDDSAFALAGEAGPKNLRASGTIGWEFDYHQRMKATAEYLRQKLTYSFFNGTQNVWMGQTAVGLNYQYDFRQIDPVNTLLDLTGYYSHSPSKNLGVTTGTYVANGVTQSFVDYQRVAGANAFGVSPGIAIETLAGTHAGLELNYDNVQYDTQNSPGKYSRGLGGTFRLNQAINEDVSIGASAAVRKPYNNYQANISFGNLEYYGMWVLTGFGEYTIGKNTMPSSYNVGIGADYLFGSCSRMPQHQPAPMPKHYKDNVVYKDMAPLVWKDPEIVDKDLLRWVSVPAVRQPEVYTVPDERVNICTLPLFSGSIIGGTQFADFVIDLSDYFSPSALVFNVTQNGVPMDPADYEVVGTTLTFFADGTTHPNVMISGSNSCGTAFSNLFSFDFD